MPSRPQTFQILTAAALAMAALLALIPAAGHDQLWFLLMAHRWLGGATLYGPQITDPNPPAIVWLSALPNLLAPQAVPAAAKLLTVLLEVAIARISYGLLPSSVRSHRWLLAFAFVTIYAVLPARDFGQRDHLAGLLLLPYLLALKAPMRTRLLTAALAAVGVCLKPQLALIPLAVELYLILKRERRPEPAVFLLTGAAYLAAILPLSPRSTSPLPCPSPEPLTGLSAISPPSNSWPSHPS